MIPGYSWDLIKRVLPKDETSQRRRDFRWHGNHVGKRFFSFSFSLFLKRENYPYLPKKVSPFVAGVPHSSPVFAHLLCSWEKASIGIGPASQRAGSLPGLLFILFVYQLWIMAYGMGIWSLLYKWFHFLWQTWDNIDKNGKEKASWHSKTANSWSQHMIKWSSGSTTLMLFNVSTSDHWYSLRWLPPSVVLGRVQEAGYLSCLWADPRSWSLA